MLPEHTETFLNVHKEAFCCLHTGFSACHTTTPTHHAAHTTNPHETPHHPTSPPRHHTTTTTTTTHHHHHHTPPTTTPPPPPPPHHHHTTTTTTTPGVASFCEGLFFCVATQSCVSLQPEAYLSLSFVHSRSCQGVLTLCWSVGPLKLSHPWCLLPRLLNQCRLVFVLLGSVLWVVCSRGFVSRSFRCWGFLTSFHLCGLPCLDHVPVPSRH